MGILQVRGRWCVSVLVLSVIREQTFHHKRRLPHILIQGCEMKEALRDDLALIIAPILPFPYSSQHEAIKLLSWLKTLSFKEKKQLITICRSSSIPIPGTTLFAKTIDAIHAIPPNMIKFLTDLITNNLTCGLLLSLCTSTPIPEADVKSLYTELLAKEMKSLESSPRPPELHFNCFFGDYLRPLHHTIDPNPKMAMYIHSIIDSWIEEMEGKIHYPHMTSKLSSSDTTRLVRDRYPEYLSFEEEGISQYDLEYLFHTTGDKLLGGPCEVKQRWYAGFLTPRTYYCAGSDAYHSSKYLRDAFNDLCDFLPPTERHSRVNPNRIQSTDADTHFLLYDLTTFTSNLHEQRHFINQLALYCKGHTMTLLDTRIGLVDVDMGDLLLEYNQLNTQPEYSSPKLLGDLVLKGHTAGFLGVFGNLASCTFLHGAVMIQTCKDVSNLGVAGDDGAKESSDDQTTMNAIRTLGLMEPSKVYTTRDPGYQVYLKRPTRQLGKRLYSDSFALYSMFEHLGQFDDTRFFKTTRTKMERLSSLASSVVSYLRSLQKMLLSLEDKQKVQAFLCGLYEYAGFPASGHLPQLSSSSERFQLNALIPTIREEFIGLNPIEMTIKSTWQGSAVVPETTSTVIKYDKDNLYSGSTFDATMTKELLLLSRLGYIEVVSRDEFVYGEEGLDRVLKYMTTQSSKVLYEVSVLKDIPDFLIV